jgi:transcriptional regulator of acetoin/glycerol metabolism
VLHATDLPDHVRFGGAPRLALPYKQPEEGELKTLTQVEEEHLRYALAHLEGNQTAVAKKLGISRSTLWRKMKEYGIEAG